MLDPWYVTGLAEGEGCFCISFAIRAKLRTGLEVRPSFSLSLNARDLTLLQGLRAFFGCGWLRESRGDRTFKYEVRSIQDLANVVLPHFERFRSWETRQEAVQASVEFAGWSSKETICSMTVCERLWISLTALARASGVTRGQDS